MIIDMQKEVVHFVVGFNVVGFFFLMQVGYDSQKYLVIE